MNMEEELYLTMVDKLDYKITGPEFTLVIKKIKLWIHPMTSSDEYKF
jgi:hypothetical protein